MKCNKFEELFIKEDETKLLEHIQSCEECRKEYEKMQAVSKLVKEAKPLIIKERLNQMKLAVSLAAAVTLFFMVGFVTLTWLPDYNYNQAISSEIYPTDEYGLVELY